MLSEWNEQLDKRNIFVKLTEFLINSWEEWSTLKQRLLLLKTSENIVKIYRKFSEKLYWILRKFP